MNGEELRRARKSKRLTQTELGAAIGYSRFAVSKWEEGKHHIPDDVAAKILEACVGELAPTKPSNASLARSTIKYYGEMRRDGITHTMIVDLWHRKSFVPTLEAQAGILAEWPELKTSGETR